MTDEEFRRLAKAKSTSLGGFLTLLLYLALMLGLLFGVPYVLRLGRNGWAYGSQSYTGSWVGMLDSPQPEHREIDYDHLPSWYRRPGDKEEHDQAQVTADAAAHQKGRAVLLTMSLDPFHLGSASLRGSARFCDRHGQVTELRYTTASVTDQGAKLITYSKTSNEFGNLTVVNQPPELRATYSGFSGMIAGTLKRGASAEFEQMCSGLQKQP